MNNNILRKGSALVLCGLMLFTNAVPEISSLQQLAVTAVAEDFYSSSINNFKAVKLQNNKIQLKWNNASKCTKYVIKRNHKRVAVTDKNEWTDNNNSNSNLYEIIGYNSLGNEIAYAKTIVESPTYSSLKVTIKKYDPDKKSITLVWDKNDNAAGYIITYKNKTIKTANNNVTIYVDSDENAIKVKYYDENNKYSPSTTVKIPDLSVNKLKVSNKSPSQITLSWNTESHSMEYNIFQYNSKNKTWQKIGNTNKNTYTIKYLSSGMKYTFGIDSKENFKKDNKSINYISAYTNLPNVSGIKITKRTDKSITFKWNKVKGASSYNFYIKKNGKWHKVGNTKKNTFTAAKLSSGITNDFAIVAQNSYCKSEIKSFKGTTYLNKVTGLKVKSKTDQSISLQWNKVSHANKYIVYQYNTKSKKWKEIKTLKSNKYTINKLQGNQYYYFTVKAYNQKSKSIRSADTVKAKTYLPTVKKVEHFNDTTHSTFLIWSTIKGAKGYNIYAYSNKKWRKIDSSKNSFKTIELSSANQHTIAVKAYDGANTSYKISPAIKIRININPVPNFRLNTYNQKTKMMTITWEKTPRATKYEIYQKNSKGKYVKIAETSKTKYSKKMNTGKYSFRIRAIRKEKGYTYKSKFVSLTVNLKRNSNALFKITSNAAIYNSSFKWMGTVYKGELYTGTYDNNHPGYVILDYQYYKVYVRAFSVAEQKDLKILRTAAIGQVGGQLWGGSACGPTAVTILVNAEKNEHWNKDNVIRFCQRNGLGSNLCSNGGYTSQSDLEKLTKWYSGYKYSLVNSIGWNSNASSVVKNNVNNKHRTIILCKYETNPGIMSWGKCTHFVVICGYKYVNGNLYFYWADPWGYDGGYSLRTVRADTMSSSMRNAAWNRIALRLN